MMQVCSVAKLFKLSPEAAIVYVCWAETLCCPEASKSATSATWEKNSQLPGAMVEAEAVTGARRGVDKVRSSGRDCDERRMAKKVQVTLPSYYSII